MKKGIFITAISSMLVFTSCQEGPQEEQFTLRGAVKNAGDLEYILVHTPEEEIDTVELEGGNSFRYQASAPEPALYTLAAGQQPFLLVLENNQEVEFSVDLQDPVNYSVQGSEVSVQLIKLAGMRQAFQEQQNQLQLEFQRRMSSGEELSVVQNELVAQNAEDIQELSKPVLEFANENKENLAGFYAVVTLYSADPTGNEQAVIAYVEDIKDQFPENKDVQAFAAHMEQLKPLSIGQIAPDFELPTPEGENYQLSDLRGKYVLLDFWAAWCAPCRDENPNIVENYHAYKDKGFTVLGVSLDRDREAWLKAIEDDELEWTQLSDLQMWNSPVARLYNINAIPMSIMLDPDGRIVGKNLRGPALKRFLDETL